MENNRTQCFEAFIKASQHLAPISKQNIYKLAERFAVTPELFTLLLSIATNGGGLYEN
jgi:hypothetical protein